MTDPTSEAWVKLGMIVQFDGPQRNNWGSTFRYGIVVALTRGGIPRWINDCEKLTFGWAPRGRRDFNMDTPSRAIVRCSTKTGLPVYFSKRPRDLTHMSAS